MKKEKVENKRLANTHAKTHTHGVLSLSCSLARSHTQLSTGARTQARTQPRCSILFLFLMKAYLLLGTVTVKAASYSIVKPSEVQQIPFTEKSKQQNSQEQNNSKTIAKQ